MAKLSYGLFGILTRPTMYKAHNTSFVNATRRRTLSVEAVTRLCDFGAMSPVFLLTYLLTYLPTYGQIPRDQFLRNFSVAEISRQTC